MPVFICQGCGSEHANWSGKCPHCGVSETIQLKQSADRMLERVIKGKYKIIRKLGQGGMGAVYLGVRVDQEFKKHLAIKVVRSGMDSGEIVARFRRERQILASLDHPNAPGEGEHSL